MDKNIFLAFIAIVVVVVVGCLILFYFLRNPFRAALGTSLSAVAILVAGIPLPRLYSKSESVSIDFSPYFDMKIDMLIIESGTPTSIWITAFVSIIILSISMGVMLLMENNNRREK